MEPDIVQDVEMTVVGFFVTVISIGVHLIFFHKVTDLFQIGRRMKGRPQQILGNLNKLRRR
jgi:uncharacterized membrane protein